MSRRKTERLLSLVVCLLSARKYLTASQIRDAVPGYPDSFDAFKRMFERDKDELRELGIPLETGVAATADEEPGYRIPRQAYVLPEIRLEPDEAAVLGLAARVWRRADSRAFVLLSQVQGHPPPDWCSSQLANVVLRSFLGYSQPLPIFFEVSRWNGQVRVFRVRYETIGHRHLTDALARLEPAASSDA